MEGTIKAKFNVNSTNHYSTKRKVTNQNNTGSYAQFNPHLCEAYEWDWYMVTYLCNVIHRPHIACYISFYMYSQSSRKVWIKYMNIAWAPPLVWHEHAISTLKSIYDKLIGTCFGKGDFSSHFHTASVFVLLFLYTFLFRYFSVCHLSLMTAVSALSVEDKVSHMP